jgi:hypothetical protein
MDGKGRVAMETGAVDREWQGQMCTGLLSTKGPGPSGKLVAGPERLELRGLLGNFVFRREDVERVEQGGFFPWLWFGIRIHHNVAEYPKRIMFCPWLSLSRNILRHLERLGYNVS